MSIRLAQTKDIDRINDLLSQVLEIHHNGRPDLFKGGTKKYTNDELTEIINDPKKPIFVYVDEDDRVIGYAFCIIQQHVNNNILTDVKTLYIDDLCVDENIRGRQIGKKLYEYVLSYSKKIGCYNLTLNVWSLNDNAIKFYEKCGMKPQKIGMETIL